MRGLRSGLLDTEEALLTKIAAAADIVFCPLAMDTKYSDIEAMSDDDIDVCLINGGVRNSETEHIVKLLREKSKVVVAFGACASMGGVPGLGNQYTRTEIFDRVYTSGETTDNPEGVRPALKTAVKEGEMTLPEFFAELTPLDEVVEVDYYLPGCPPTPAVDSHSGRGDRKRRASAEGFGHRFGFRTMQRVPARKNWRAARSLSSTARTRSSRIRSGA